MSCNWIEHWAGAMQGTGPMHVASMDTASGTVIDGPEIVDIAEFSHQASRMSPDRKAVILRTARDCFSVLDLPSLRVRGSLKRPGDSTSFPSPSPEWHSWAWNGTVIVLVWMSSDGQNGTRLAVYDAATCKMTRRVVIPVPAKLKGIGDLWTVSALAPDTKTVAVSLFDQHSDHSVMRVVILDIAQDMQPVVHNITNITCIQDLSVPELTFSPSGKFLAITLEPDWAGNEEETGPGVAYVLEIAVPAAGTKRQRGPMSSGRAVIWCAAEACALVAQRVIDSFTDDCFCRVPVVTATTQYTDPEEDFENGLDSKFGMGGGFGRGFGYGGMGYFDDEEEDEDTDAFHSMLFGQSHKKTLDRGFASPCGSMIIALATTSVKTQVEHWQIDSGDFGCTPKIVHRLTLPSQMYVHEGFAVAWHPTLQHRLIYALAVNDKVLLIDGRKHRVIRSWGLGVLGSMGRFLRAGGDVMKWSPDGTTLAVLSASKWVHLFKTDVI